MRHHHSSSFASSSSPQPLLPGRSIIVSGLLSDIKTINIDTIPNRCNVHRILSELDAEDHADLVAAIDDAAIMHVAIARALIARGHDIHPNGKSIAAHRKAQCGCARG